MKRETWVASSAERIVVVDCGYIAIVMRDTAVSVEKITFITLCHHRQALPYHEYWDPITRPRRSSL